MGTENESFQVTRGFTILREGESVRYEAISWGAHVFRTALTGSTQDDMAALWRQRGGALAPYTALVADEQTTGRGRVGRSWFSVPDRSLTISVLVVLPVALAARVGWLTLMGGAAARSAMTRVAGSSRSGAVLKISWPNDVVAVTEHAGFPSGTQRKVAGVLGEYIGRSPETGAIATVVGLGANLGLSEAELPTPTAASLQTAGFTVPERAAVAAAWLDELKERVSALIASGDPCSSGALEELNRECATLRPAVTVGRPRDTPLTGHGLRITGDGSLILKTANGDVTVTSGEVSLFDDTGMPRSVASARKGNSEAATIREVR